MTQCVQPSHYQRFSVEDRYSNSFENNALNDTFYSYLFGKYER